MKTAIIVHGSGGNPEESWFPWMQEKLQKQDYTVFVPHFPPPQFQSLASWTHEFENCKECIDADTLFIAHSVGAAFVLSLLETLQNPVKACYFVSGFLEVPQSPEFDPVHPTLTIKQFDWQKIHQNCPYFFMCHGSDDPYIPLHHAEIMAENLAVEIDIIDAGGHLDETSGYTEFPYLLSKILGGNSAS